MRGGAGWGEGTEESVRRMEANISQGPAGAPKGTPGEWRRKMSHRNSLGGKNKEVGVGTKFKIGKLILNKKKIKLLQPDVIF